MRLLAVLGVLGTALALSGCAMGIAEPGDASIPMALLADAVETTPTGAESAGSADDAHVAATWQVTVSGEDLPADAAEPVEPAEEPADEPAAEPIDEPFDEPADESHLGDEPAYDVRVVSDESIQTAEGDADAPADLETSQEAQVPDDPQESTQEVITTPGPAPSEPFKPGGEDDETAYDPFSRSITSVPLDIRPTEGILPENLAAERLADEPTIDESFPGDDIFAGGEPADVLCSYTPWTICYRPLYFEDIPLERYGENVGYLQTGLSGVKFFGSILALPYKMTVHPPRSCQCSNGFSRCGDCPLPGYGRREFRWDASLIEAAAVAGVVYILP